MALFSINVGCLWNVGFFKEEMENKQNQINSIKKQIDITCKDIIITVMAFGSNSMCRYRVGNKQTHNYFSNRHSWYTSIDSSIAIYLTAQKVLTSPVVC